MLENCKLQKTLAKLNDNFVSKLSESDNCNCTCCYPIPHLIIRIATSSPFQFADACLETHSTLLPLTY